MPGTRNLTVATLLLLAISPRTAAQIMLLLDRYLGARFFDSQAGGSPCMRVHFFWIFGHPEVYILPLPAFGFANEIIPVFSRKAIFGYPAMVAATLGIAFVSMGVWAHHMFTVGMTSFSNAFFTLSTMLVSLKRSTGLRRCGAEKFASPRRCCSRSHLCCSGPLQGLPALCSRFRPSIYNCTIHTS